MATKITTVPGLLLLAGTELGTTDWYEITQDRVDLFADATDDHQWIHVDPRRAAAESRFGGPIAHGYLTLSLLSEMVGRVLTVEPVSMGVNYGLNRVRFPAPVPVGSRIRLAATLLSAERVSGGVQVVVAAIVECDRADKPVCVAEAVYRFYD
ncbi:MaoC family dehydratase [Nocardia jinanensis]|uniref:MaoC family dehydratase n=1 Tax=Nocardia jinanensis TaxID=382504 RepID=A0A917VT30_9NOCA|nr:MaoC family dehydratase [Nocardia jinanensis]GGL11455.1 MaoC family dehydratase [Nocardia jinanensis]